MHTMELNPHPIRGCHILDNEGPYTVTLSMVDVEEGGLLTICIFLYHSEDILTYCVS